MSAAFLKKSLQPFHSVPCSLKHSLLVTVCNRAFRVMLMDLQAFGVVAADSLVQKSSQKDVRFLEDWGSWWPKAKSGNAITEEVVQETSRCICS